MLARIYLLTPLLVLAGCLSGATHPRVTSDYAAQVKDVGILSLLAAQPNVSYLGPSALESRFGTARIDAWDSDGIVASRLLPRLERKGYTVHPLPRTGALAAAQQADWRPPIDQDLAAAVYDVGATAGLDVVVVVEAELAEDFVSGTNQKIRGYGVQRAFDTEPRVYAAIQVTVYDIENRFVAGRASGRQFAAAATATWQPAFESIDGVTDVDEATAAALATQLEPLLGTAIGSASQEAGL